MLGLPKRVEPVFAKHFAGPWLKFSAATPFRKVTSSAMPLMWGSSSENQAPDKDGNYLVNHTASVFLMDRNGQYVGTIDYGENGQTAMAKIKRLAG